jgi:serine/threonine protein phosphatase PrpC
MLSSNQERKYDYGHQKRQKIDELIQSQKGVMERLIIKEPHISPSDNQKIGKTLMVLYIVNVVSKDLKSDLICILIT